MLYQPYYPNELLALLLVLLCCCCNRCHVSSNLEHGRPAQGTRVNCALDGGLFDVGCAFDVRVRGDHERSDDDSSTSSSGSSFLFDLSLMMDEEQDNTSSSSSSESLIGWSSFGSLGSVDSFDWFELPIFLFKWIMCLRRRCQQSRRCAHEFSHGLARDSVWSPA